MIHEDDEFFNNNEKNRIKKDEEINKYKQKTKELEEKLDNKDDNNMPYLETEEEAAERIEDSYEKKGKGYVDLPILLSKLNINTAEPSALARSSKELVSNIKQLVKNLYDNKQITKQVYNILNKAITCKNDS